MFFEPLEHTMPSSKKTWKTTSKPLRSGNIESKVLSLWVDVTQVDIQISIDTMALAPPEAAASAAGMVKVVRLARLDLETIPFNKVNDGLTMEYVQSYDN